MQGLDIKIYLVLFFVQVLFGMNFVTSKYVLSEMPAWDLAFVRFFVSGLGLFALAFVVQLKEQRQREEQNRFLQAGKSLVLAPRDLLSALVLGLLSFALSQTLFLQGLALSSAANAAILMTTIPLLTYLVALTRGLRQLERQSLAGFFLAFLGVLALQQDSVRAFEWGAFWGDGLVLLGALGTAIFISYSKDFFSRVPTLLGTAYLFTLGSLGLIPALLWRVESLRWGTVFLSDFSLSAALVFTVFGATLLPYGLSHWVVKKISAEYMALFIFIQPLVASLLGWFFLEETLKLKLLFSAVLVGLGLWLVGLKEGRNRKT